MRPLLSAYVDQELGPEELARVEDHLATCPACREVVARHLAVARAISRLGTPKVSPGFAQRVLSHPSLGGAPWRRRSYWIPTWDGPGRPAPHRRRRPTWLVPAAAAVFIGLLLLWDRFAPGSAPPLALALSGALRRAIAAVLQWFGH